jgi:hypothetical protein
MTIKTFNDNFIEYENKYLVYFLFIYFYNYAKIKILIVLLIYFIFMQ